ncbi:HAD-IA family hydrolase [Streptomyces sp. NPDC096311]|uniref:HAD-IA family hydrolase n=1 Tax=Streptomyces sp. NPDC096311 TaxID=3366083 RepID=UPI003809328D
MTRRSAFSDLQAIIVDWNGVIGRQPTQQQWAHLAACAGWPIDKLSAFQQEFWQARPPYDAGQAGGTEFWRALVRGTTRDDGDLLADLCRAETAMWMGTDDEVLQALHPIRASGTPVVLLSNAPTWIADAVDDTRWRREVISEALYSARIKACKPSQAAYEKALAAAGNPDPARTLFIDDRAVNCVAAAGLGMRTLHYVADPHDLARHLATGPEASAVPQQTGALT